jgi:hypothetical protein
MTFSCVLDAQPFGHALTGLLGHALAGLRGPDQNSLF